jgi:hypothetical protein
MKRIQFLQGAAVALLCMAASSASLAQGYPNKPIRLIVPFPAGGATDLFARTLGQKMGEKLGTQLIIDNKPGAGGAIGSDQAAKAPADGYTLLLATTSTHSIGPAVMPSCPTHDTSTSTTPIPPRASRSSRATSCRAQRGVTSHPLARRPACACCGRAATRSTRPSPRRRDDHLRAGEQRPGQRCLRILWDGKELHGLNASGRAPKAGRPSTSEEVRRRRRHPPKRGIDSVTVPGAVVGLGGDVRALRQAAVRRPAEPAIDIAERGYLLPPVVQGKWAAAVPELGAQPGFAQGFLPWGRAPERRRAVPVPGGGARAAPDRRDQGRGLLRRRDRAGARALLQASTAAATVADFAAYQPEWVKPISRDYRGHTLHEIPPNGQGIAALIALGILEKFDLASLPVDGAIRSTCRSRP